MATLQGKRRGGIQRRRRKKLMLPNLFRSGKAKETSGKTPPTRSAMRRDLSPDSSYQKRTAVPLFAKKVDHWQRHSQVKEEIAERNKEGKNQSRREIKENNNKGGERCESDESRNNIGMTKEEQ